MAALLTPSFNFRHLLLIGTGALSVAHLPFWLNWIQGSFPQLVVRVAITPSAARFVSVDALRAVAEDVVLDAWDANPVRPAPHVALARWADAALVHPAGMNFIARLAQGLADTPVQMALQLTEAVIGVAPALPPGHRNSPALRRHLALLADDPRVVVGPTGEAVSATTGSPEDGAAAPVPVMFSLMEQHRSRQAATTGSPVAEPVP